MIAEVKPSRLPEIAACLLTATWDGSASSVEDLGILAIHSIGSVCRCAVHQQGRHERCEPEDLVCLQTMAETIAIFLWILLDSDIDEDVLPSSTGLANLYTWQSRANDSYAIGEFYEPIMNCEFPVLGIDLVFHVLSGLAIPNTPPKYESLPPTDHIARVGKDHLARVGDGLCVYHWAVKDPTLPLETMFRFRIVRGYISFSGLQLNEICGFKGAYVDSSLKLSELRGEAPMSSVQTVVRETEDERQQQRAYLIHYFNEKAQLVTRWLHLPFIFRKLQQRFKYSDCAGNCPALYDLESSKRPNRPSFPRGIDVKPLVLDKEEHDRTQEMLSAFKHDGDTWTLLSSPGLFTIITGQPILLYALINQSTLCLLPFKDCLNCIMRTGMNSHV